jgi:hypothetical protein
MLSMRAPLEGNRWCGAGVERADATSVRASRLVIGQGGRSSVAIDRIWSYAPDSGHVEGQELTGYTVAAADGTIGQVDRQADHAGMRHLVVDTGVWVFGRSVLVPVGVVTGIDASGRKITLSCTRGEVKAAPRFRTDSETMDPAYLARVGEYYHRLPPRETTTT